MLPNFLRKLIGKSATLQGAFTELKFFDHVEFFEKKVEQENILSFLFYFFLVSLERQIENRKSKMREPKEAKQTLAMD